MDVELIYCRAHDLVKSVQGDLSASHLDQNVLIDCPRCSTAVHKPSGEEEKINAVKMAMT